MKLSTIFFPTMILALLTACNHSDSGGGASSGGCSEAETDLDVTSHQATYCVTFTAKWTKSEFEVVPGSAHFTSIVGAAVNNKADLWAEGELASAGLEDVAENGKTTKYKTEINDAISANRASGVFVVKGTGATESRSFEVKVDRDYPGINFATMVAPSPDWFVGLSNYELLDVSAEWLEDSGKIDLPVYDAGTESGKKYSLENEASDPLEKIARLTETVAGSVDYVDGMVGGNSIATVRFKRLK